MIDPKTGQDIPDPGVEPLLEHILTSGDENAKTTHQLLENNLEHADKAHSEKMAQGDASLEMQVKTNDTINQSGTDVAKAIEKLGPTANAANFILQFMQAIKGDKGDPGADSTVPGPQGTQGPPGNDATNPVRGTDYFTQDDIDQIVNAVRDLIPDPKPGRDGTTPVKGVDYFDGNEGKMGPPGPTGPKGPRGPMVTAEEIISKIRGKISYNDLTDTPTYFPKMAGTGYLREITDVQLTNLANNDTLKWDSTKQKWVNGVGGGGSGTVTSVSVTTANGVSGSVANATTTPAITITLGAITPTSVAASGTVSGSNLSGTNTGDQTNITGNAGTATALQNARTIGGVSFNGTANITVATATGGFTVSGGALDIGSQNLTMTGSLAATGARVTKGWFTDLESTNMITIGGTSLASATVTFTNKRINPRIGTEASSATSTPTSDTVDQWNVTALAAADAFAAPSGTPVDGQRLIIRIKDNGTARALTWNAIYRASSDLALPSTTIISKTLYLGFIYNAADVKWDLLALLNNF